MSLYLGNNKQSFKVIFNGEKYIFNIGSFISIIEKNRLLSSEGYALKDSNENYLVLKESE